MTKTFDLNIGKILEDWEMKHALREIIANAIDEYTITNTQKMEIFKNSSRCWHIRDYGRGLESKHFQQNENEEKQTRKDLIGKFGIGLKDALATIERSGARVTIESKHLFIPNVSMNPKVSFEDIDTLTVQVEEAKNKHFSGTEYIICDIKDEDVAEAKQMFLHFSNHDVLDSTRYGEILKATNANAEIYLNGMKIADEEDFLFSYNITSTDKKIAKSLNRERMNLGRNVYSERIKKILLESESERVAVLLANEFKDISNGESHYEITWVDVQKKAYETLNKTGKYVFVRASEINSNEYASVLEEIANSGKTLMFITEELADKIGNSGSGTLSDFILETNKSFEFEFVDPNSLRKHEKDVLDWTPQILRLIGGLPRQVKEIKISETMQLTSNEVVGIWDSQNGWIIIKRSQLAELSQYAGTLIHEVIHAKYNLADATISFEAVLTNVIGELAEKILN